jgi:hypothetical protein
MELNISKLHKGAFPDRIESSSKLKVLVFSLLMLCMGTSFGQMQIYDNFEGDQYLSYGIRSGVLDTLVKNPMPNDVNNSASCAFYVRNGGQKFDNIKMNILGKLGGVGAYTTHEGVPPKIHMKLNTTAPPGTLVEILLGSRGRNNEYPAGTNSQYQAYTTIQDGWEDLEFVFSQIPEGSETDITQVDQLTLLFYPNSSNSDTYYFDEIKGPSVVSIIREPVVLPENAVKVGRKDQKIKK